MVAGKPVHKAGRWWVYGGRNGNYVDHLPPMSGKGRQACCHAKCVKSGQRARRACPEREREREIVLVKGWGCGGKGGVSSVVPPIFFIHHTPHQYHLHSHTLSHCLPKISNVTVR